jgi:hypothetical protein
MFLVRRAAGRRLPGAFLAPTGSEGHGAQGGSKAPLLRGGTGATRSPFFSGEHGEEPPFDAAEHRGTKTACFLA